MKKYKLLFIPIIIIIALWNVKAQPNGYKTMKDTTSFIKDFNEKSKKTTTNEADFIQEKYISVMTEKSISKGKFYFKKTNLMRWETTEPLTHVIVLNNGKMMIKEKGKVKIYDSNSNKMFKGLNDLMLTTAGGKILNSKDYTYRLFESEKYYLVELIPLNSVSKKMIRSIEITIEKSNYTVSQIKMIEPSNDYTRIEFLNKKLNMGISDTVFILK